MSSWAICKVYQVYCHSNPTVTDSNLTVLPFTRPYRTDLAHWLAAEVALLAAYRSTFALSLWFATEATPSVAPTAMPHVEVRPAPRGCRRGATSPDATPLADTPHIGADRYECLKVRMSVALTFPLVLRVPISVALFLLPLSVHDTVQSIPMGIAP